MELSLKLPYQIQIYDQLLEAKDGLAILSPGIGLSYILVDFVKLYATQVYSEASQPNLASTKVSSAQNCQVKGLVLLINADWENLAPFFATKIQIKNLDSTYSSTERQDIYRQGGVIAVTSRILIVDFLSNRVPIPLITGFLVANAHQITPHSSETFILRIFRQQNKVGFIKAFSDRPELFTAGFAPLERTLKLLHLRTTFLWPRFQSDVAANLEASLNPIQVTEFRQPLTKKMKLTQASIMDCLSGCLSELKRSRLLIDLEEDLTLERALASDFTRFLRKKLESVWHRVGFRTRELISDISTLQLLLTCLTSYDCVSFLKYLETIISSFSNSTSAISNQPSSWLLTDAANSLVLAAKSRVYNTVGGEFIPVLEEQPKWAIVRQALEEIEEGSRVLIITSNPRSSRQIRDYLSSTSSPHQMLQHSYTEYLQWKKESADTRNIAPSQTTERSVLQSKRRRVRGNVTTTERQTTLLVWKEQPNVENQPLTVVNEVQESIQALNKDLTQEKVAQFTKYFGLVRSATELMVHTVSGDLDDLVIDEFSPSHVIIVDPEPSVIRRIEAYQATKGIPVQVYFLVYTDSVEEQRFLSRVRREKDSFELLIREKGNLAIPIDHGLQNSNEPQATVVVDVREFRSSLPSALHQAGLNVIPITLTVGDYVLTPTICVERKSIPDLILSFKSGRLYDQTESMLRHYKTSVLLIEFDENKTFSLEALGDQKSEFVLADISSKLVLLLLSFPQLKVVWSSSPAQTAQLFIEFKRGVADPDPETCAQIGLTQEDSLDSLTNSVPLALLQSLPGITFENYRRVMRNIESIETLCSKTLEELQNLIGATNAGLLYEFLNGKK